MRGERGVKAEKSKENVKIAQPGLVRAHQTRENVLKAFGTSAPRRGAVAPKSSVFLKKTVDLVRAHLDAVGAPSFFEIFFW